MPEPGAGFCRDGHVPMSKRFTSAPHSGFPLQLLAREYGVPVCGGGTVEPGESVEEGSKQCVSIKSWLSRIASAQMPPPSEIHCRELIKPESEKWSSMVGEMDPGLTVGIEPEHSTEDRLLSVDVDLLLKLFHGKNGFVYANVG